MATQPSPVSAQPPPDLPYDPRISPSLAQYLRTFALWVRGGFQERPPSTLAIQGILLLADDGFTVYQLGVTAAGALTATLVTQRGTS